MSADDPAIDHHRAAAAPGSLEAIWIKRVRRGPMDPRDSVAADPSGGLEGNAQSGRRQVTLLSAEAWEQVEHDLGRSVDPRTRRANLFVRGIDLEDSRGKTLRIGGCRIEILGETRPCRIMDDAEPGLEQALDPDWRGGVYGRLLDAGRLSVGDPIDWVD
ncbi:MAG: MOSC domain-containing protein [Acidobacteriota bacterium]